jgi:hypothetical protein
MNYLFCRVKVADFAAWKRVFETHRQAHGEAGLKLLNLMRNVDSPNDVFVLMQAADLAKARAFVTSPDVPKAKEDATVIGMPEICFLSEAGR